MKYDIINEDKDSVIRKRIKDKMLLQVAIAISIIYVKLDEKTNQRNRYQVTTNEHNQVIVKWDTAEKEDKLTENAFYCIDPSHKSPVIVANPYHHVEEHILNKSIKTTIKITIKDIALLKKQIALIQQDYFADTSNLDILYEKYRKLNILSFLLINCSKLCNELNEMEKYYIERDYDPYSYKNDKYIELPLNQLENQTNFEFKITNPLLKWVLSIEKMSGNYLDIIWRKLSDEQRSRWLKIASKYGNSNIEGEKPKYSINAYHHVVTEELSRFANIFLRSEYYFENKKDCPYKQLYIPSGNFKYELEETKSLSIGEGNCYELYDKIEEMNIKYGFHEKYWIIKSNNTNEKILEILNSMYEPLIVDFMVSKYTDEDSEYRVGFNHIIGINRFITPDFLNSAKKGSIEISHEKESKKKESENKQKTSKVKPKIKDEELSIEVLEDENSDQYKTLKIGDYYKFHHEDDWHKIVHLELIDSDTIIVFNLDYNESPPMLSINMYSIKKKYMDYAYSYETTEKLDRTYRDLKTFKVWDNNDLIFDLNDEYLKEQIAIQMKKLRGMKKKK